MSVDSRIIHCLELIVGSYILNKLSVGISYFYLSVDNPEFDGVEASAENLTVHRQELIVCCCSWALSINRRMPSYYIEISKEYRFLSLPLTGGQSALAEGGCALGDVISRFFNLRYW